MEATASTHQRRTFARANGLSGTGVPHLVAAEERHRKNVQHIQQLKAALCSTVSAAAPSTPFAPLSRDASLPSSSPSLASAAQPAWSARARDGSNGLVTTPALSVPPPTREPPLTSAALQRSQQEVEQLVREKHQLQRQCVELATLLANAPHGQSASSAVALAGPATQEPDVAAWSPVHDAALAVVEQVTRCYPSVVQDWAVAKSSAEGRDHAKGSRNSIASSMFAAEHDRGAGAQGEGSAYGDAPDVTADELADALHRLAAFLPQLASMTAVSELIAEAGPDMLDHIHVLEEEKRSDCLAVLAITDHLTKVSAQMRHEAAEKDAALASMRRTVEELLSEKQEWVRRARVSEEALAERYTQYRQREKAWEKEVAELLRTKDDAVAVAPSQPAVEEASAAAVTAAEAEWRSRVAALEEALDKSETALASAQQERDAAQTTHTALQTSSREATAMQEERIESLTQQLQPLETELQSQAATIRSTLERVEALTAAHRAEVDELTAAHSTRLSEKEEALRELLEAKARMEGELAETHASVAQRTAELQAVTAARDAAQAALEEQGQISVVESASFLAAASTPLRLTRARQSANDTSDAADGNEDDAFDVGGAESPLRADEADNDQSTDSISRCTDVRRLQQSLKRMSRERAALKRKLEHRGTALAEMEGELESAQRVVAQQEARLKVLQAGLDRASKEAAIATAPAAAPPADDADAEPAREPRVGSATVPILWLDFAELEGHEDEGTLYPTPVDLSDWLLSTKEASTRLSDYVAQHLSSHDQLLMSAVGPLYHVGWTLLKAVGLLGSSARGLPLVWRRFLLQLQQVLDSQLGGLAVSPADSAKCFYASASSAHLFDSSTSASSGLTKCTCVLAALCVCLRPEKGEEGEADRDAAAGFCTKWECCQAILQHVCDQHGGEHGKPSEDEQARNAAALALFRELASQRVSSATAAEALRSLHPIHSREREPNAAEDGHASAASPPTLQLADLLSSGLLSDALPVSQTSLQLVLLEHRVEGRLDGSSDRHGIVASAESAPLSPTVSTPLPPAQLLSLACLLLYIARYECLLDGCLFTTAPPATYGAAAEAFSAADSNTNVHPSLDRLGIQHADIFARVRQGERGMAQLESLAAMLALLDTGLLPATMLSVRLCHALEREQQLLSRLFETRSALVERCTSLLNDSTLSSAASSVLPLLAGVRFLPDAQLWAYTQRMFTPPQPPTSFSSRVVQVPTAEYERLHREILSLYRTNEKYDTYIHELLGAAEAL